MQQYSRYLPGMFFLLTSGYEEDGEVVGLYRARKRFTLAEVRSAYLRAFPDQDQEGEFDERQFGGFLEKHGYAIAHECSEFNAGYSTIYSLEDIPNVP